MPQGKMKVKTKLPASVKNKKKAAKGPAVTKRSNKPIAPKKSKLVEVQKMKRAMSKSVNMLAEEDLRQKALDGRQTLGKKRSAPSTSAQDDGPSKKKRKQ